ncbi:MAG: hypothetical protein JNM17_30530 [Archangium sp.]|nr:hypothetical protein [Archangium sp.]
MKRALILAALALTACPERTPPERGIALTFKKPDETREIRATVDRRLAHLKLKAHLSEDRTTFTARMPNGLDVERIKALLSKPGLLSFCEENAELSRRVLCERIWPEGIEVDRAKDTCSIASISREKLQAAVDEADAGIKLVFEKVDARISAYALAESSCFDPHIVGVEIRRDPIPGLMLEFDKNSAGQFNALTAKTVGKHLLILVDGDVSSAPVVNEPIDGKSAMLVLGRKDDLELMSAVFAGGALPKLELVKEARYGPPSLSITGK